MTLDWEAVRLFAAIADAGSLTQAARHTGLSQPTLGRRLKELEDTLGGALFERLPNQLVLTALGAEIMEMARAMAIAAENLQHRAQAVLRNGRQPVRISATMSISEFLTRHLAELSQAAATPDCDLHIDASRVPVNLAYRETDIAIRLRHYPREGPMKVRRLGVLAFCMYGPREGSCSAVVGLTATRPPPQPGWVEDFARAQGLPVRVRLGEYFLRHRAARSGQGATLLPCFIGDADPLLRRLCDPPPALEEEIFLLAHDHPRSASGVQAMAESLVDIFRRNAALLSGTGHTVQPPA